MGGACISRTVWMKFRNNLKSAAPLVRSPMCLSPEHPPSRSSMGNCRWICYLGDLGDLRAMDVFPKYSLLTPARSKNPQEVRDAFRGARTGVFGRPKCIQVGKGGRWENEYRAGLCSELRIKPRSQGAGARPLDSWASNGHARGIHNQLAADDGYSGNQILSEFELCVNTLISDEGIRLISMFSVPTRQSLSGGMTSTRIRSLRRIPCCRADFPYNGSWA